MGPYVAKNCVKKMIAAKKNLNDATVLVMGATFKEDVSDIRNSKVADIIKELKSYSVSVEVVDPLADSAELEHEYGFGLIEKPSKKYEAIIVAVNHKEYMGLDENYFKSILTDKGVLVDIKGMYRNKIKDLTYWSF